MDDNAQDHFQTPCPMIKLQSSDGQIFEVEVKVAKMSSYIKNMLDDLGVEENEVIPIPQNAPEISGAILKKIIQWANHHKDDPFAAEDDDKVLKPIDEMSSWDAEFLEVDQSTLFQMIRAADYLNINGLLDVTCIKVAKMIKGKTPEEVRRTFHIQNDFSPDEEEQVRQENAWCVCEGICVEGDAGVHRRVVGKIPASSVQDEDNDSSQVTQDCLNTSLVLRKIFQHFSDPELLELSCVNKCWNSESRVVMKKRGKIMTCLVCSEIPYYNNIEAFGAALGQMNVVPYSGVTIVIHSWKCSPICGNAALDSTTDAIHTRLALKHLSVKVDRFRCNNTSCSAFLLAKKLLQDFSGVLEQLTFYACENEVEILVQDCVFRRLKMMTVHTYGRTRRDEAYTSHINALVLRAPNLKELHINGLMNLMGNVLEGSSAVLVYEVPVTYPFDQISDSVMRAIRFKDLNMSGFCTRNDPGIDFERFNRTVALLLLQAPRFSRLSTLRIDEVLEVLLMCYGIPLKNVTKLVIDVRLEPVDPHFLRIVKAFDFTRIFPNLNEVSVWPNRYSFELLPFHVAIIELANGVLREPKLDRAARIKSLDVSRCGLSNDTDSFFVEMFPNIEKLRIEEDETAEIPFGSIWKHWMDLQELQVDQTGEQIANLDSVFCGIFPEEVAELRQMDDEYLKTVNIVPVMPAITGLKNLKTLKFKFQPRTYNVCQFDDDDDDTFLFSKVTGFIAFERCPSLTVSLEFWNLFDPPATKHLEPFTSMTFASM